MCALKGWRGLPSVGRAQSGVVVQGQVLRFSRHTEKPNSAAWTPDWLGCREDREASAASLERKASWQKGQQERRLCPTPP